MRLRFLLAAMLLSVPLLCRAGTIEGRVYLDLNGDGAWQATDRPAAGALVSDGVTVVAAGVDGRYALTCPDADQLVFIENPAGTRPGCYYRHMPGGAGTADFALQAQEQQQPFYFLQGTDLHVSPTAAPQVARYVAAVNALEVPLAFVVHTGDLVVDSTNSTATTARRQFLEYREMVRPLNAPLLDLPGNHEHVGVARQQPETSAPEFAKGLYRELFGPTYYAFNYAGIHFVALDGTTIKDGKLSYGVPDECLSWLEAYLAKLDPAEPLVLLIHEPLGGDTRKAAVEKLLEGRKVLLGLAGHWHTLSRLAVAGAPEIVGGATSYSWHGTGFPPNAMGYQLIRISKDGFESACGDWAQRYPVTVVSPARGAELPESIPVRVQFLDPKQQVTSAEVALGDKRQAVTEFGTEGLYRTLTCTLGRPALPAGFHDLTVTLRGGNAETVETQPFLVLNDGQEAFTASGPATLRLKLHRVNADDTVRFNGEQLAVVKADAGAEQSLSLTVPAEKLRDLNVVELVSAPLADGSGYDDFSADWCEVSYAGKVYRDYRLYTGAVQVKKGPAAATATLYFDLSRPER